MSPTGPQPCARLSAQAPSRAAASFKVSSVFCFPGAPPFQGSPGPPWAPPLPQGLGAALRHSPHFAGSNLGRLSRPSNSTVGLSPFGALRSPPGSTALRGTGRSPAPLVPPPGGNSRTPASLPQGEPLGASLQTLAVCPRPRAAHCFTRGPGFKRGDGPPASPAVDSRVCSVTHFAARAGPGRFQDRPPVPHLHLGTRLPGDGTPFLRICTGPSGGRGLSVRHLRIVGLPGNIGLMFFQNMLYEELPLELKEVVDF
ncbi:hypothetical protein NDU88_003599 [Pleurodeles waltl]|uniref:Uncharacterized protein n=1 Tax=Pleurodeles waltl TaxID=8319 RepID=A0AAV7VH60_PLEWA|nr:hypothetical protein NDU88_003599 [Pleurodeles waltl]